MKFEYRQKSFEIDGTSENDHIYRSIVKCGMFYEIDLLNYLYSIRNVFRKPNSLSIDVGANIGNHSIFFRTFLTDGLIAVEPNPEVTPVLERNLGRNLNDYSVYSCGLGEFEGVGRLVVPPGGETNVGMTKLIQDGVSNIRVTTLDNMLEDWQRTHGKVVRVTLIKVDVEGMELPVLKGAKATIEKYRPQLLLEAATESDLAKLEAFLSPLGYKNTSHWGATAVHHFAHKPSIGLVLAVIRHKLHIRMNRLLKRQ